VTANPRVAEMLLGPARKALAALGEDLGRQIEIRARPMLHQEQFEVTALDAGPPVSLSLSWLGGREAPDEAVETGGEEETAPPDEDAEKPAEVSASAATPAEGPEDAAAETAEPEEVAPATEPGPAEPVAPAAPEPLATASPLAELLDVGGENPILPRSEGPEES
jgi:hypothetical protein